MKMELLLKIGGVYNILCAVLHLLFPKLLNWSEVLRLLPVDKLQFIEQPLYIMNWCLTIFWLMLAYIPLVHTSDLLKPGIGRTLLSSIVIFWIIRILVLQPVYIGLTDPTSWKLICFFIVGLALFAVPLVNSLRTK